MKFIVDRVRYDTESAEVLAHNQDHNSTRWQTLYKSKNGAYFCVLYTLWQGECDRIDILDEAESSSLYEDLLYPQVEWEEAFPNISLTDG